MKERDEFDDYIKGLFKEDPKVPIGLEWKAMDIELPKATKNGKNNKKFWGILLLLLLLASSSVIFFGKKKKEAKKHKNVATADKQMNNETQISNLATFDNKIRIENKTLTGNDTNTAKIDQSRNKTILAEPFVLEKNESAEAKSPLRSKVQENGKAVSNEIINKANAQNSFTKDDVNKFDPASSISKLQPKIKKVNNSKITNQYSAPNISFNNTKLSNQNQSIEINTKQKVKIANGVDAKISTYKNDEINSLDSLESITNRKPKNITASLKIMESALSSVEILPLIISNILPSNNKEIGLIRFHKFSKENQNTSKEKITVVFAYGNNAFNLKVDDADILKDKLKNVLGSSYKAGIKIRINENWKTNVLLNFNQLHSTFEHTRDLEPIYDIENSLKTKRKEITFHNNYNNTLGLQLGVERNLYTIKKVHLQAGLAIVPTYSLSTNGKTIKSIIVEKLVYNNEVSKFSLGAAFNFGMIYSISKSMNFEAAYQLNWFFVNEIFINNNVNTNQQNIFTIGFAYSL